MTNYENIVGLYRLALAANTDNANDYFAHAQSHEVASLSAPCQECDGLLKLKNKARRAFSVASRTMSATKGLI